MSRMIKDPNGRVFESVSAMARFYNLKPKTLFERLNRGWTIEQCIKDAPVRQIKKENQTTEKSISSTGNDNKYISYLNNKYINYFIRLNKLQILSIDEIEEIIKKQYRKNVSCIETKIYKDNNIKSFKQYVKYMNQFGLDKEIVKENLLMINFNEYITLMKLQTLNVGR